ncbi:histidine kinase N-terminal 7TM domain-containing diguanylate cyclase [Kineococcus sp. SYSU DK001]|uniref:histidine kinase N-terminal 7TM domain-containing diguanylate cyclase n=1 Tax=Kineococcus sp. SYSU DK001 TaxID=3383122 RepID=UPI003D7D4B98
MTPSAGAALTTAFAVAALLNAATAALAWRYRGRTPAARALAGGGLSLSAWSVLAAPQNLPLPRAVHDVLLYGSLVGVLGAVVSLHLLARFVADPHGRPSRRHVAHLVAVPALILALTATDPLHHLVFSSITPLDAAPWYADDFGPVFWAHTAWCYLLLADAGLRLGRAWLAGSPLLRSQAGVLLLAGAFPLVGNVAVLVGEDRLGGQDLTPLFFTATAVLDAWAVLRGGLLRTVPVAREAVLETIGDHVVVIDAGGVVVDVNPAGRAYLRDRRPDLPADPVGVRAAEFLSARALGDLPGGRAEYVVEHTPGLHLDVRVTALTDRRGRPLGRVVVGRDITALVRARERLEEEVAEVERLRARLAEEAVRDPLTGLHNRRHFTPAARDLVGRASAVDPVAVLVVDVDHFKAVNDTHGHAAGDEVLVAVARTLAAGTREGDLLARTGGEEFALVLPGVRSPDAAGRAERLRAACAALAVELPSGARVRPTVSIGTALTEGTRPLDDLLARADEALYAAKAAGRDRVVANRRP